MTQTATLPPVAGLMTRVDEATLRVEMARNDIEAARARLDAARGSLDSVLEECEAAGLVKSKIKKMATVRIEAMRDANLLPQSDMPEGSEKPRRRRRKKTADAAAAAAQAEKPAEISETAGAAAATADEEAGSKPQADAEVMAAVMDDTGMGTAATETTGDLAPDQQPPAQEAQDAEIPDDLPELDNLEDDLNALGDTLDAGNLPIEDTFNPEDLTPPYLRNTG